MGPECRVHLPQLHADDATADDEQGGGYVAEGDRRGRIHDAIARLVKEHRHGWARAGGEDGAFKLQGALAAVGFVDLQGVGVEEAGVPLHVGQLARPDELTQALRHLGDDRVLGGPQLGEVDRGRGKLDAPVLGFSCLVEELGNVQEGFGGDAASIEADAAGVGFWIDQGDIQPQVCGLKGGNVSARAAADDR